MGDEWEDEVRRRIDGVSDAAGCAFALISCVVLLAIGVAIDWWYVNTLVGWGAP